MVDLLDGGLVDRLPDRVARDLGLRFGLDGVRQVRATSFKERSSNAWFRGARGDGDVFVKLYARSRRARVERRVAAVIGPEHTTELLGGGMASGIGECSLFRWEDITSLPPAATSAVAAGTLLAVLHEADPPPLAAMASRQVGENAYQQLLVQFACQLPDVYADHRGLLDSPTTAALARDAGQAAASCPQVLRHGDFSLRNIGARGDGRHLVFDFERAEIGPAEFDLERVWDRELVSIPSGRRHFLASYRAVRGLDATWPDPALLRYARLVCALTTIMAARRTDDKDFEVEGKNMLEELRC